MIVDRFIVLVFAMLEGPGTTAAGVAMELNPFVVFLVAIGGSFTFTGSVLFVAGFRAFHIVSGDTEAVPWRCCLVTTVFVLRRTPCHGTSSQSRRFDAAAVDLEHLLEALDVDRRSSSAIRRWHGPLSFATRHLVLHLERRSIVHCSSLASSAPLSEAFEPGCLSAT
jgi:hypothetical protein